VAARFAIAAIVCAALAVPASAGAQAEPLILRGVTTQPGTIHLYVLGRLGDRVLVSEIVNGTRRPLIMATVPGGGTSYLWNAAPWTCVRTSRRFIAANASGEFSYFSLRTPSCRNRIAVAAPTRARRGAQVRVRLSDTFVQAGTRARLCVRPPVGRGRCRRVRLPSRGRPARSAFRVAQRGRWRVVISTRHQRTVRTIAVGVPERGRRLPRIFFTGDSMMQSLDNVVTDRLAGRAETSSEVFTGGGLSKPALFDITGNTRTRVRRLRASATVAFLGANEGFPLSTGDGPVGCCGEAWVAAYTRKVRGLIRAGGRRTILLTLPAPRERHRQPIFRAVNEGLRRAVALQRGSMLIDLVPVFSPGFVYHDWLPQRGKPLYVRETDGIHISVDGAPIVAKLIIEALERSGALRRRH